MASTLWLPLLLAPCKDIHKHSPSVSPLANQVLIEKAYEQKMSRRSMDKTICTGVEEEGPSSLASSLAAHFLDRSTPSCLTFLGLGLHLSLHFSFDSCHLHLHMQQDIPTRTIPKVTITTGSANRQMPRCKVYWLRRQTLTERAVGFPDSVTSARSALSASKSSPFAKAR